MLLRAPTLAERYPYLKWLAVGLMAVLVGIVTLYLNINQSSQTRSTPTPTVVPSPSPTPIAYTITEDEIKPGWSIYIDKEYGFSMGFPSDWTISIDKSKSRPGKLELVELKHPDYPTNFIILNLSIGNEYAFSEPDFTENYSIAGIKGYRRSLIGRQNPSQELVYFQRGNDYFSIQFIDDKKQYTGVLNQVLSTFKFLDQDQALTPTLCTQEAKVCPDGSSVGRTGPNCEFASCPQ